MQRWFQKGVPPVATFVRLFCPPASTRQYDWSFPPDLSRVRPWADVKAGDTAGERPSSTPSKAQKNGRGNRRRKSRSGLQQALAILGSVTPSGMATKLSPGGVRHELRPTPDIDGVAPEAQDPGIVQPRGRPIWYTNPSSRGGDNEHTVNSGTRRPHLLYETLPAGLICRRPRSTRLLGETG